MLHWYIYFLHNIFLCCSRFSKTNRFTIIYLLCNFQSQVRVCVCVFVCVHVDPCLCLCVCSCILMCSSGCVWMHWPAVTSVLLFLCWPESVSSHRLKNSVICCCKPQFLLQSHTFVLTHMVFLWALWSILSVRSSDALSSWAAVTWAHAGRLRRTLLINR